VRAFVSQIQTSANEYIRNKEVQQSVLDEYYQALEKVLEGIGQSSREKHKKRGKLLARERIENLLDSQSPLLELSALAANGQYDDAFPSAGIITAIGKIHGHYAVIVANDATIKGGTYVEETIKKHLRVQEIALQNRLPIVYMVDSGGVFLPNQAEVFPDRDDFGRIFYNQARLSAEGIPQVAIVMGSCTAGGAYIPAMSDEAIIVRNQGTIFLGGPPLVKSATGETVSAEELGGGDVHAFKSGVADHLAENDIEAIEMCRDIFESFPAPNNPKPLSVKPPVYDIHEIYGILPPTLKQPYDVLEVIARLTDGSEFNEFKANYGTTLVTVFAKINGQPVGIIGNNGVLFSESALKGTHFIELCCYRKIPIVFLQNISGFMVGKEYEHGGIARNGAKMVHAVANANVPKITIIIGGSFGAGNYAMGGRAYNPNFLFMWPQAKISVMGGEQAAGVLVTVKEEQLKSKGEQLPDHEKDKIKQQIIRKYQSEGSAYYSTSRLWDDGIILPHQTREVIATTLDIVMKNNINDPKFGVYRM